MNHIKIKLTPIIFLFSLFIYSLFFNGLKNLLMTLFLEAWKLSLVTLRLGSGLHGHMLLLKMKIKAKDGKWRKRVS